VLLEGAGRAVAGREVAPEVLRRCLGAGAAAIAA